VVNIIWTKRDLIALDDFADYIAKGSAKYAQITVQLLIYETKALEKHLLIGKIVPEYDNENFIELIRGNYRIIYQKQPNVINILTVHYASRDLLSRKII